MAYKENVSPLQQFATEARRETLMRNEWAKDKEYTKALVNAEYRIQSEFKLS